MRTNIELDDDLITQVQIRTGLTTKREIVEAALRFYIVALDAGPTRPTRALANDMIATREAWEQSLSPEERAAEQRALDACLTALGEQGRARLGV